MAIALDHFQRIAVADSSTSQLLMVNSKNKYLHFGVAYHRKNRMWRDSRGCCAAKGNHRFVFAVPTLPFCARVVSKVVGGCSVDYLVV